MTVTLEVKDYSDGYGFWGKLVCKSDVRGMTNEQVDQERRDLTSLFPGYAIVEVFEVPALR